MDIGSRIKKYREEQNISQEELALKIFVSRQTISNWETDKSYPDIKSLIMLSNIFNVSLDNFIKKDIEEMRKIIDSKKVKEFNVMSYVFLVEMLVLIVSAYPLFKLLDFIGFIIWISLYIISFGTASIIERFKKENNIQTYKEIIAFIDGKKLTYEETQQEIGKRMYQKIILAFVTGIITFIVCLIMMFIMKKF
jgi:transcriptional regulator with XRE-family HTH domain